MATSLSFYVSLALSLSCSIFTMLMAVQHSMYSVQHVQMTSGCWPLLIRGMVRCQVENNIPELQPPRLSNYGELQFCLSRGTNS